MAGLSSQPVAAPVETPDTLRDDPECRQTSNYLSVSCRITDPENPAGDFLTALREARERRVPKCKAGNVSNELLPDERNNFAS